MIEEPSQVVILPAQFSRLASLSRQLNRALGISQDGSILHINTGDSKFDIDANGDTIEPRNQEKLC